MRMICASGLAALLVAAAGAAMADMDYVCLNSCVNGGKPSSTCMSLCSYGQRSQSVQSTPLYGAMRSPHDQFTPPTPADRVILHPSVNAGKPDKDYACVTACQQGGHPYQYCDEHCTSPAVSSAAINSTPGATTTADPSRLIETSPVPMRAPSPSGR